MELLNRLCEIRAISGFEYLGCDSLKKIFDEIFDETYIDPLFNVTGYVRCGKKNAPLIMLEAHYDSIGLMVKGVHEGGFVSFVPVGGVDPRILPGSQVVLHGKKDICGICGAKPPHLLSGEDMEKAVKTEDICIDTGYSKEELLKNIEIGTPITVSPSHFDMCDGKFCGNFLDNRAGLFAVLKAAKQLKSEDKLCADICVLASTAEETFQTGARCAARKINPDVAVVVDVTHGITPDVSKDKASDIGGGAVICIGPNLSRHYNSILFSVLEENAIEYQTEVEEASTGTNAWVIQTTGCGVPCVLISIPVKYMHTPVEVVSIKDIDSVCSSIVCFVKKICGGEKNA